MASAIYPKWKEQLLQFTANNDLIELYCERW